MSKPKKKAQAILKEIERVAAKENIPIVGPIKGRFLGELVRKYKPCNALEIGTAIGYSAIAIAINLPTGGQLETLEINPQSAVRAKCYIQRANLENKVSIITGDALKIVPTLSGPYRFVFIDAKKSDYHKYLKALNEKIRPGSILVADNVKVFASAMREYLKEVRNSPLYESSTVDFHFDALEVSVRKM